MKTYLLLLCFILTLSTISFADWKWQSTKPQGNNLNSVSFISENTGWIVGDLGTILKTTNGGESWETVYTDSSLNFKCIFFTSENIGYVSGEKGIVYKTIDGGKNWLIKNYDPTLSINTIYFISENTGWIGGDRIIGFKDSTLYKTTDGGDTWIKENNISNFVPTSIRFFSDSNGWILGTYASGNIYCTTDRGNTWKPKHLDEYIYDISFAASESSVYEIGNFGFFRHTSDGGKTWEEQHINHEGHNVHFKSVFFISESVGWIAGMCDLFPLASKGIVYKTIDGGKTLQVVNNNLHHAPNSMYFISDKIGWAVGDYGLISKSTDGGFTWIEQSIFSEAGFSTLYNSDFISENKWWISGSEGTVLKTTNAGSDWVKCYKDSGQCFLDIDFASETTGWICGYSGNNGIILKTTDGGSHWQTQLSLTDDDFFKSIFFISDQIGWAASGKSFFLTTDGGQNWEKQNDFISYHTGRNKIFFINDKLGWFIDPARQVSKTTDGGHNWLTFNVPVDTPIPDCEFFFLDIFFITEKTGWIAGSGGLILKTTDGGETWIQKMNTGKSSDDLFSVCFISENTGWVSGNNGKIFKTTDGGLNWVIEQSHTKNVLYNILVFSENTGWAIGSGGVIIGLDNNSATLLSGKKEIVPGKILLFANYPNPFNPSTVIGYQLPVTSTVELKVYDMLGREVATLVNQEQQPGNYEIQFNASGLTSGIYFYRLNTGDYTSAKKMTVIK